MTTEQGNKLIAEFMGWRFIKWCGTDDEEELPMYQRFEGEEIVHPGIFHAPEFHEEWNSIMPVVEKIETIAELFTITSNYCSINNKREATITEVGKNKIQAVWQAVIRFIEWYNKNNPNG